MPIRCALFIVLLLLSSPPADAGPTLTIDVTSLTELPPRHLGAMMSETDALWRPYGVAFRWATRKGEPAPADANFITLTVIRETAAEGSEPGPSRARRLGAVLFTDGTPLPDRTVRLSIDVIKSLVMDAHVGSRRVGEWPAAVGHRLVSRAIGRVLAHEIGHYLLASRTHTRDGLMRSEFTGRLLTDPGRRAFTIPAVLLPRLRDRLAAFSPPEATVADSR